jgi:acylaminoacyl-peptidase
MFHRIGSFFIVLSIVVLSLDGVSAVSGNLQLMDVFSLEYASDPQISPNGDQIVYVRNSMDVMKDKRRSELWVVRSDGSENRPLTTGKQNDSAPRWVPDGRRLLYVSSDDGTPRQLTSGRYRHQARVDWTPDSRKLIFAANRTEDW